MICYLLSSLSRKCLFVLKHFIDLFEVNAIGLAGFVLRLAVQIQWVSGNQLRCVRALFGPQVKILIVLTNTRHLMHCIAFQWNVLTLADSQQFKCTLWKLSLGKILFHDSRSDYALFGLDPISTHKQN